MNQNQNYVEVILPLSLNGTFTYHYDSVISNQIQTGKRVVVSFGSGKLYTGIIYQKHSQKPEKYKTKPILAILDEKPWVTQTQICFWQWISSYYLCSLGDVYRNSFPAALKLESETYIELIENETDHKNDLSDNEYLILEALQIKGLISVKEAATILDQKSVIPTIKKLADLKLLKPKEKLKEKYKPKQQFYLKLSKKILGEEVLNPEEIQKLERAPKQRELFLQIYSLQTQGKLPLKLTEFLKSFGGTRNALNSLEEKGLVQIIQANVERIGEKQLQEKEIPALSHAQKKAYDSILKQFQEKNVCLLHGITSSGKTEIYMHWMRKAIQKKQKVLYLLPEIGLTTQLVKRLERYFGNKLGVYHSKFNQNERVELWQKTLNGEYDIMIGPRSALFLPFPHLDCIIVDEEHDSSFKQNDQKPFYQARDSAILLAQKFGAKTLLGSATPSLESYFNAKLGKYGFIQLKERFGNVPHPKIELIDMKLALKKKMIDGSLSSTLKDEIQSVLDQNLQAMVFLNRRGFAPIVYCEDCGHTSQCTNCDIQLNFHKKDRILKCHYCGHQESVPVKCPSCRSTKLSTKGLGTEQLTKEIEVMFPNAKVARMDHDTMRRKHAYEKMLEDLEMKEIDILVGTQIITKGLDFDSMQLVSVVQTDSLFQFADFRAEEKAFQMLTQVAGRAGRRKQEGSVFLQTYNPEHSVLQNVKNHDYEVLAKRIIRQRKQHLYSPWGKMIHITFRHRTADRSEKTAIQFTELLKPFLPEHQILGPESPSVARVRNQYIYQVFIKISPEESAKKLKDKIQQAVEELQRVKAFRAVRITIDVDPN